MAFSNPPNYGPFLSPPTVPFIPEPTDLGTMLRAIQGSQQFVADEKARGIEQGQRDRQLGENERSNQATEKYNFGNLDLQRSLFDRKNQLLKEESEAERKKTIESLIAELNAAQRSKNSVRVAEVKQKLQRFGLTVSEIEAKAPPPQAPKFSGDPIPPGTKVDDLDDPYGLGAPPDPREQLSPEQRNMLQGAKFEPPNADDEALANLKPGEDPNSIGGALVPGNIPDLLHRKQLKNPDGSVSTTSSMSFEEDGKEILIPTVVDGTRLTEQQAIDRYHRTGEHLGIFSSPEEANRYAESLHQQQAEAIPPQTPSRGLEIRDAQGKVIQTVGGEQFGEGQRLVEQGMRPIVEGAPDYGKDIAIAAMKHGMGRVEAGEDPIKAMDAAIGFYEGGLAEKEKTRRTAVNAAGPSIGGLSGGLSTREGIAIDNRIDQKIQQIAGQSNLKNTNVMIDEADKLAAQFTSDNAVANKLGIAGMIKNSFGAAASEGERGFILGSFGKLNQLQMAISQWTATAEDGQQIPPQIRSMMREYAALLKQEAQARRKVVADAVYNDIMTSTLLKLTPDERKRQAERGRARILRGDYGAAGAPLSNQSDEDFVNSL